MAPAAGRGSTFAARTRYGRGPLKDLYTSDHAESRQSGRYRWLLSTCLAGAVGALAILVVIAGSTDTRDATGGLLPGLGGTAPLTFRLPSARVDGLRWAVPKTGRFSIPSGPMATKFVVLEAVRQRRGSRDYILNKPYARIVARLAPLSKVEAQAVPVFNPFKLYANTRPLDEVDRVDDGQQDASTQIVDLLGGVLANEDGQEMDAQEVSDLVAHVILGEDETASLRAGLDAADRLSPGELLAARSSRAAGEVLAPNTSVLAKSIFESEEADDDAEGGEVRIVKIQRPEALARLLSRLGAEPWQARAMADAARTALPDGNLAAGQELHVTLALAPTRANRLEPIRVGIYAEGPVHQLTIARNAAGEFVASQTPVEGHVAHADLGDGDQPQASSLYASLYSTALRQGIPHEVIFEILKVHAYETDFRQRVRPGDGFEAFFDIKEEDKGIEGSVGELLATSITSSGETHKFYRYRTPDGLVDYYDEEGNTSRKFLMRRPVRGEDVRITSGFGMRRHPILQTLKMHTGVDWACAPGTPIMAAGAGVIEEAGRKGEYGNYIRIRHANGYKTAYGHMQRFAPGVSEGVKVRQGQIIGYVGTTGLSSGPHVHFEVLVNNGYVDPMSIQVPRERLLTGKQLGEFQKERLRIDDLMRQNPVATRVADVSNKP
jgi:murein DD-endopeptidase MepM/ murein hydrolase activator NlpD